MWGCFIFTKIHFYQNFHNKIPTKILYKLRRLGKVVHKDSGSVSIRDKAVSVLVEFGEEIKTVKNRTNIHFTEAKIAKNEELNEKDIDWGGNLGNRFFKMFMFFCNGNNNVVVWKIHNIVYYFFFNIQT